MRKRAVWWVRRYPMRQKPHSQSQRSTDTLFHSPQLCQSSHPAEEGVAGIHLSEFLICEHKVAVIGPERHAVVVPSFLHAASLFKYKGLHHAIDVNVAVEVIILNEISCRSLRHVAQMDERDPFCETLCEQARIIVLAGTQ